MTASGIYISGGFIVFLIVLIFLIWLVRR